MKGIYTARAEKGLGGGHSEWIAVDGNWKSKEVFMK
jgi:hypothetical protein